MDATSNTEKYQATWESLRHYRVPRWYQDAKFGIFIHWGVYSEAFLQASLNQLAS